MKSRKVGIIGPGHGGAHVMYSLAAQRIADELVLIDINGQKAEGERRDPADRRRLSAASRARERVGENRRALPL